MTKLRKQRRRKQYRHNVNRKRLRNKIMNTGSIQCNEIKDKWESKKSARVNMSEMGLCYDPNANVKSKKPKRLLDEDEEIEEMTVPGKIDVALGLISEATAPRESRFRLPKSQIEYLTYYLNKYGSDYKKMAKDKKNVNQETWKQIRAKIRRFRGIPEQFNKYLTESGKNINEFNSDDNDDDDD